MEFLAPDKNYAERIRASFQKQGVMNTIGGKLLKVEPGEVQIEFPFSDIVAQQHGFVHPGILTTVVDSACGYAASTLMPADSEVLSVEYKVNFLSPAHGSEFLAVGKVFKPGRTIMVCSGEVLAKNGSEYKTVALMQATMIAIFNNG